MCNIITTFIRIKSLTGTGGEKKEEEENKKDKTKYQFIAAGQKYFQ